MIIKYIKMMLTLALLLGVGACTDLEMKSDGRDTLNSIFSNYGKTSTYFRNCLASVPQMGSTTIYGPTFLSSFSDEAQDVSDILNTPVSYWYAGSVTPLSNPITLYYDPWTNLYITIRRCNTFLQSIDDPELATYAFNETEKNGWIAQIRVIRAYAYLQLMKRYGGVPVIDTAEEMDITYDYSQAERASIEDVADYIIGECDLALATPESEGQSVGFRWALTDSDRGQISRAFAQVVKSEAALYAASPLWNPSNSGKYTWAKAAEITKATLDACLTHGFELYNIEVNEAVAQNPYAYYFIQRSDPSRQFDKETIYESSYQLKVWQTSGTPVWPGMTSAGTCPSQELIDAYETIDGQPVLNLDKPYNDADHLDPNYNQDNRTYDSANPYANRDPRFYASIYYNMSPRKLAGVARESIPVVFAEREMTGGLIATKGENGEITIKNTDVVTGGDYIRSNQFSLPIGEKVELVFEYKNNMDVVNNMALYAYDMYSFDVPKAADWTEFRVDFTELGYSFWDYGSEGITDLFLYPNVGVPGYEVTMRNIRVETTSSFTTDMFVETFSGGNCEMRSNDQRYTRTGYYLRKYNNHRSSVDVAGDGYMKMFRLAELYLNFAEAAYNATGPDGAVSGMTAREAVNKIRNRAGMPDLPAGMTKEAFEKRYRNERRIEMAFEEQRFFDVRRWKILGETDGFVTGMEISKEADGSFLYTRKKLRTRYCNTDKFLMFPIQQSEVTKMNALTGKEWQNPLW